MIGMLTMAVVGIVAVFVVNTQVSQWREVVEKVVKNHAVQECLVAGREEYDVVENNSKVIRPNKETYRFCMNEKGY